MEGSELTSSQEDGTMGRRLYTRPPSCAGLDTCAVDLRQKKNVSLCLASAQRFGQERKEAVEEEAEDQGAREGLRCCSLSVSLSLSRFLAPSLAPGHEGRSRPPGVMPTQHVVGRKGSEKRV